MPGLSRRSPGRRSERLNEPRVVTLKRPSTKELLIDAGEQLFGRHGFDGISLREIANAIGHSNSNAVQYYFKNKAGLVTAIMEDRGRKIEDRRRDLMDALQVTKELGPRDLIKIILLPSLAIRDANGAYPFCRFILQQRLRPTFAHPLAELRDASGKSKANQEDYQPCLTKARRLLRAHYNSVSQSVYNYRISALIIMFLSSVVEYDNARELGKKGLPSEFDIDPILDMAVAVLNSMNPGQ
jgi:AcrR family transcriptional regulator